jgi:DNA invertase Pin-like site-specific DNA recombinase
MNVSKVHWSHPVDYQQAKSWLIGRQRYHQERRQAMGERCDVVFEMLLQYGWASWGTLTKIARELQVHRSTITRDKQRILRAMLGP